MDFDITQFETLFRDNYANLCRYACDIVGDMDDAEDIVSEAFATLWGRRHLIDEGRSIKSYMYVMVRNSCITFLSHHKPTTDLDRHAFALGDIDPALREEEDQLISEINNVIDTLTPRTRRVLDMCVYEGTSYKEASETLGISVAGVKKHIVKAYATIREHFGVKKQ